MIDADGYRHNVGIIIVNKEGKLFWGKRIRQESWQFPQGGIKEKETPQQAVFRELKEEVGLSPVDIRIIGRTKNWLSYDLPKYCIRKNTNPICVGQKQIWFLLGLVSEEEEINLNYHHKPEFDGWAWVDYWHAEDNVIDFKKEVYRSALIELEEHLKKFWLPSLAKI